MTPAPEEARALAERLGGYTSPPWTGHNMVGEDGNQMTPEELGEYVTNSVKMGSPDRFLFVSAKHDDGDDCDICLTGNGPRGPQNTALIAAAPDLHAALTAALDEVERLTDALTRIRDMKPHHAGQTTNEFHMQQIAGEALKGGDQ